MVYFLSLPEGHFYRSLLQKCTRRITSYVSVVRCHEDEAVQGGICGQGDGLGLECLLLARFWGCWKIYCGSSEAEDIMGA